MVLVLIVMNAFYTAKLASFLTVENKVSLVDGIKDLISPPPGVRFGAKATGSTISFFSESNSSDYMNMYRIMTEDKNLPKDNNAGVEMAKKGKYAFLMESSTIEYTTERVCEVVQVGKPLDEKGYGVAMKKSKFPIPFIRF